MLYRVVMCLALMLLSSGCAGKHVPAPVIGVDIVSVKKGQSVPFDGTLFSPFYLETYLQWKDRQ